MANERFVATLIGVMSVAATVLAACTPDDHADSQSGSSAEPVVLTLANFASGLSQVPAVQYFVDRVEELSGGSLRVSVDGEWGGFTVDVEQHVVRAVAAGEIELAWVGTRVFDTLGINNFRALTAPMLIDNYPLQRAVIGSDIPDEMLAELDDVGVTGIAVLADGLRKPIAVDEPLLSPDDYDDLEFTALRSTTLADSIRALGAIPGEALADSRREGLSNGDIDGFEQSLVQYGANQIAYLAPYVTTNVNLWAIPVALIANPAAMEHLTDTQREWIMQAGADAADHSTDLADDEADLVPDLCEAGARFAEASAADLQAMHQAFADVFTTLDRDPQTKEFIEQIEELKEATDPGPALTVPPDCTGPADTQDASATETTTPSDEPADPAVAALNGTYRWTITRADALDHGITADKEPNLATFPLVFTMTMKDSTWRRTHRDRHRTWPDGDGSYTIDGDQITFEWPSEGHSQTYTYAVEADGSLNLVPEPPINPSDVFLWSTHAWERVD